MALWIGLPGGSFTPINGIIILPPNCCKMGPLCRSCSRIINELYIYSSWKKAATSSLQRWAVSCGDKWPIYLPASELPESNSPPMENPYCFLGKLPSKPLGFCSILRALLVFTSEKKSGDWKTIRLPFGKAGLVSGTFAVSFTRV